MAGFGDNSTVFQRVGVLPFGGLKVEGGCWTAATDATAYIPTTLTNIYCLVCATDGINDVPCISAGFIKGTFVNNPITKVVNYIAVGS